MNHSNISQHGYILIMTLFMITMGIAIGTYIFTRGIAFLPITKTNLDREKAELIALAGVQVAMSQLGQVDKPSEEKQEKKEQSQQESGAQEKQFFMRIAPTVNRWQQFRLKEKIDGIDGEIKICIVCEEGKIDLNRIYDFQKHVFLGQGKTDGDWKKIMADLCTRIETIIGGKDLFSSLEKFLKKCTYPLNDVTELLTIKEFEVFRDYVFYEPTIKQQSDGKATIYLTDIFTLQSSTATIEPRLFSHSMLGLLKFKQAQPDDVERRSELIKKITKNFKITAQWKQDWNSLLQPLYEKELQSLPKGLDSVLSTQFDPKSFAVLSYGTIGAVTQRLLAIVERDKRARNTKTRYDISIKKMYWL